MNLMDGPLGYAVTLALIFTFFKSFTWKKQIAVQVNPDEELGRAIRRAFRILNKKEDE